MDTSEYLASLPTREVTLTAQRHANDLLSSFTGLGEIDRVLATTDQGDNPSTAELTIALGKDTLNLVTGISLRKQTYGLNRELGLTVLESLRHSSPAIGIAVASIVTP